jgi:hypothetical protein
VPSAGGAMAAAAPVDTSVAAILGIPPHLMSAFAARIRVVVRKRPLSKKVRALSVWLLSLPLPRSRKVTFIFELCLSLFGSQSRRRAAAATLTLSRATAAIR